MRENGRRAHARAGVRVAQTAPHADRRAAGAASRLPLSFRTDQIRVTSHAHPPHPARFQHPRNGGNQAGAAQPHPRAVLLVDPPTLAALCQGGQPVVMLRSIPGRPHHPTLTRCRSGLVGPVMGLTSP